MRNFKILTAFLFVCSIMLCAFSFEKAKKNIFDGVDDIGHTTAVVSENEIYDNNGEETDKLGFSNESVELVFLGKSKLTFTAEDGREVTVPFGYGFKRLPNNNTVSVMYDKADPKKVSIDGFDHPDYGISSILLLFSGIFMLLSIVFVFVVVIAGIAEEHRIYKREKRVFGEEISGYKILVIFRILTLLAFVSAVAISAYTAYNASKISKTLPISNDALCGFAEASVTEESYTFTAQNGAAVTKTMEPLEKLLVNDGKIKVRYLLADPQTNSADNAAVYFGVDEKMKRNIILMPILGGAYVMLFILTLIIEASNKRQNRKRGYVDHFKMTKEDIEKIMNSDE